MKRGPVCYYPGDPAGRLAVQTRVCAFGVEAWVTGKFRYPTLTGIKETRASDLYKYY